MPPMTPLWDLFLLSVRTASETVLVTWCVAIGILIARWSIRYIDPRVRVIALNAFDLWLVLINLFLFIAAKD